MKTAQCPYTCLVPSGALNLPAPQTGYRMSYTQCTLTSRKGNYDHS